MADVACPVCCEVGRPGTLVLRQINAEEAVYVCNNSQCPYPVGTSDSTVLNPVPELREDTNTHAENGKRLHYVFSTCSTYGLFSIGALGQDVTNEANECVERTQEKTAIINEYEVNILLDPELDSLMEEL